MKFLVDEDLPRSVSEVLVSHGHNAIWARRVCPGAPDEEVVRIAALAEMIAASVRDRDDWLELFAVIEEERIRIRRLPEQA